MGKRGRGGGRGGGQRGGRREGNNQDRQSDRGPSAYDLQIGTSEGFNKYYRAQGIVADEEWDDFIKRAQTVLPMTFRVTASRENSKAVNDHVVQDFVPFLSQVVFQGEKQPPPQNLKWYPGGYAWQLDVGKQVVRKSKEFAKFQQFLVHETDSGNISRQEAVSMIPPLLLDVHPHHYVLDCCAAPGSKTVQLLEALHARSPTSSEPTAPIPEGLLIANDSDAKRCHMLVHQSLNRIGSPNCMITNLDAASIPSMKIPNTQNGQKRNLLFDRILCDVPCSGDGTTRKNPGIWKTWKPADGLGLHSLQLRILTRAIQLLKPGGRLVYSTCSYNPMENEAVVSAALNANPSMSLVDVSQSLPGLIREPGLLTWKVFDRELNELSDPTQSYSGKPISDTCWPSGREKEFHLERCLRLYPHLQNTGGFFVSVLEKTDNTPADATVEATNGVAAEDITSGAKRPRSPAAEPQVVSKKPKVEPVALASASTSSALRSAEAGEDEQQMGAGRPFNEDPYSYLPEDDQQLKICMDFFKFSPDFPSTKLFVRNAEGQPLRSVYLSSGMVRTILENNDYARLRLISCGVKVLVRQDPGKTDTYRCRWRVTQDGLPVLQNFMGASRKIKGDLKALRRLCTDLYPTLDDFEDGPFKESIEALESGSLICEFTPGEEAGGKLENSIALPLWRAPNSLCLMVEKTEKKGLSMRIFGEDLSIGGKKGQKTQQAKESRKADANAKSENPDDQTSVDAVVKADEEEAIAVKADEDEGEGEATGLEADTADNSTSAAKFERDGKELPLITAETDAT